MGIYFTKKSLPKAFSFTCSLAWILLEGTAAAASPKSALADLTQHQAGAAFITKQQSAISIAQSPAIEEPPLLDNIEPLPASPLDIDMLRETQQQAPTEESALPTIEIRNVEIDQDRTLFDEVDFLPIYKEAGIQPNLPEGVTQRVTLPQLRNIANGITQLYVSQGYITSLATPPKDFSKPLVDQWFGQKRERNRQKSYSGLGFC